MSEAFGLTIGFSIGLKLTEMATSKQNMSTVILSSSMTHTAWEEGVGMWGGKGRGGVRRVRGEEMRREVYRGKKMKQEGGRE